MNYEILYDKNQPYMPKSVFRANLENFKLLTSGEKFAVAAEEFRKKFRIKPPGASKEVLANIDSVMQEIDRLMRDFKVQKNFKLAVGNYLLYGKIDEVNDIPKVNFFYRFTPSPLKAGVTPTEIGIISYKRLTTKEKRMADKVRDELEKLHFPKPLSENIRPRRNIERDLKIEQAMRKRERPRNKEVWDSGYLDAAKKSLSYQEFEKLKKERGELIKIVKVGKTTKDVIREEKFRVSEAIGRQAIARLKKERQKRFGTA